MTVEEVAIDHKRAYQLALTSAAGQEVLHDLQWFCGATTTDFRPNALEMARMAGRREVWLRMMNFLNLDHQQIAALYNERIFAPHEDPSDAS